LQFSERQNALSLEACEFSLQFVAIRRALGQPGPQAKRRVDDNLYWVDRDANELTWNVSSDNQA
jgi:hypothetical protein